MELKISYKNGSTRVVRVVPVFFEDVEVRDRHKTTVVTVEQKCRDIAAAGGAYIYDITLTEGTTVVFQETNKINKPEARNKIDKPAHEWIGFMKKDELTKEEMKELKKGQFTKKWNPRKEPMAWERGLRLLLNGA